MKKIVRLLSLVLVVFTSIFLLNNSVEALEETDNSNIQDTRGVTGDEGKILIPFIKNWSEDVDLSDQPSSITVTLYKYIGDSFDTKTAIKIEEAIVEKAKEWKYDFDISKESLMDANSNPYKFAVVESDVPGFHEVFHTDPHVVFTPPSVDNGWNRITPCSELNISSSGDYKSIVIMKKGSDYVVWSVEALSPSERLLVFNSTQNISGMSGAKFENCIFISGINGSHSGMTITEDKIMFAKPKDWSFFATGVYNKSSTETNSAQITNAKDVLSFTVSKVWNDLNDIDRLRPSSVSVQLLANGKPVGNKITLNSENKWTHTFKNIDEYFDGQKITYTVSEDLVNEYEVDYEYDYENNHAVITNTHEVKSTIVKAKKVWQNTEIFGMDLPSVVLKLYYRINENDTWKEISEVKLNNENNWEYTWTKANGLDILPDSYEYKVEEVGFADIDNAEFIFNNFFDVTYENSNNEFTITNICKATFEMPETGSSMMLFIIVISISLIGIPSIYMVYSFIRKYI